MLLEIGQEPITWQSRDKTQKRSFILVEHTSEELESYQEKQATKYDSALELLRKTSIDLQYGRVDQSHGDQVLDSLRSIKDHVAENSASLIAELLHPTDGESPVDERWVRRNMTRRQREQILDKQDELDGVERIKEQSFLIERSITLTIVQVTQAIAQQAQKNLTPPTLALASSIQEYESLRESLQENQQEDHVPIDELETMPDGMLHM